MIFHYKNTPIHYETFGSGPAIILLHGFLESSTMWKPLIPQLSKNNFVITIDFPGHGKSGVLAEIHTMELMAEVVNEILQHLQISTATFIGHSMGGYVTLAFAEMFLEKIEKIILLNSTTENDDAEKKAIRERSVKILDSVPEAFISMAISNLFTEESKQQNTSEIEKLKAEANTFPVAGIQANIKGMKDRQDRKQVLKNFKKGKFLIAGLHDTIVPYAASKEITENTNTTLITFNSGHMAVIENLSELKVVLNKILN
ncbi:putative hydrolase or acyltransferase of alpha/beta superfamily [Aequorivita sublithincola DSM 14238]|uniref:Putative hydrolase or acyltransferase of alpha/beta superfamily n=1 Tax=Aequorivita sublithincola (strain DSM 14238 / LMG 21431 / ACAM 643 / 9-3) TaxID=746697 RepID=I3YVJ5_AEQSU|nr:alpha/beta hydrolase [Aequorivita sublithincola]AFL81013.1 putative hydrolase or acyltransferase of alpha/beta superfamily [Aequorivita sublithincola DSM 14238]